MFFYRGNNPAVAEPVSAKTLISRKMMSPDLNIIVNHKNVTFWQHLEFQM